MTLETTVFREIGAWKNYDELEESLSLDELMHLVKSVNEKQLEDYKFQARLAGADVDDSDKNFEDIRRRALIKAQGGDPDINDVTNLRGAVAEMEGFGIGLGLEYTIEQ